MLIEGSTVISEQSVGSGSVERTVSPGSISGDLFPSRMPCLLTVESNPRYIHVKLVMRSNDSAYRQVRWLMRSAPIQTARHLTESGWEIGSLSASQQGNGLHESDPESSQEDHSPAIPRSRAGFHWKTRAGLFGVPLICIAFGADEHGKMRVAKGFVAVGQIAIGGISVGPLGAGIIALGQVAVGLFAFGQMALGVAAGFGQFAAGFFAVGQFVAGHYGLGQMGWADYLWSQGRTDMEAVAMFDTIRWLFSQPPGVVLENLKDAVTLGI